MDAEVVLHIGVPKSGTTFVQEVLWTNPERLRQLGWTTAASKYTEHVHAAGDIIGRPRGRVEGAWSAQLARIRATPLRVVFSQELLARARSEVTGSLLRTLAPRPVRVVVSARDPVRQVASSWQQHVKQRFVHPLADFAEAVIARAPLADHFWLTQDLIATVDAWLAHLPADQITLVTVPPAGSALEELWYRFATACGLDAAGFDLDVSTPNASLGAAQIEVLRRVNVALEAGTVRPKIHYGPLVRRVVANDLLAQQVAYAPFGVDEDTHAWATSTGEAWAANLRDRGVRVVGSLDDLVPAPYSPAMDPQTMDEADVAAAATEALAGVLVAWAQEWRAKPEDEGKARDAGAKRRPGSAEEGD